MSSTKEIRRRIKSIQNTSKITKAMEMVSAAKMRKSVESVVGVREYAHTAWNILLNLSRAFNEQAHPLLNVRPVRNVLMVVIASNRGLCGSFNSQILKKLKAEISNPGKLKINRIGNKRIHSEVKDEDLKIDCITIGRKGEDVVGKVGKEIIGSFNKITYLPKIEDIKGVSGMIIEEYLAKRYDKVVVVYTDYVSPITQRAKVRQILPISKTDLEKQISEMDGLAEDDEVVEKPSSEYKVEPSPTEVLNDILPKLIEMQIYHSILESNASKEAMRMMAMRNATEAAGEMAGDLTFVYNQIRQMKITQEIAEISAGRAALE